MDNPREVLLTTRRFNVVRHQIDIAGHTAVRESIQHPGAVTILPLLEGDRICLIRNHRTAVGETLIELPAGTLEPGEPPEETARRELAEETGYLAGSLAKLHEFYMSPGILNERMHLFLASDLTAGPPSPEPGEQIETLIVPRSEAIAMAHDGRIQDAKTLVGILLYQQTRDA